MQHDSHWVAEARNSAQEIARLKQELEQVRAELTHYQLHHQYSLSAQQAQYLPSAQQAQQDYMNQQNAYSQGLFGAQIHGEQMNTGVCTCVPGRSSMLVS